MVSASEEGKVKTTHSMRSETSQRVLCMLGCRVAGVLHRPRRATGAGRRRAAGGRRSNQSTGRITGRPPGSTGRPPGSGEDHHLRVRCSIHLAYLLTLQGKPVIAGQLSSSPNLPGPRVHKCGLPCADPVSTSKVLHACMAIRSAWVTCTARIQNSAKDASPQADMKESPDKLSAERRAVGSPPAS